MRAAPDASHFVAETFAAMRREAGIAHQEKRADERDDEHDGPDHVRHAEIRRLGDETAGNGPAEHRGAFDDLALREHGLELAAVPLVAGERQRVDEPRLDRAGKKREAEPEQHRRDRPRPHRRRELPRQEIEQRRHGERQRAEQIRQSGGPACRRRRRSAPRRRTMPGREECVRDKRLGVGQSGVEQEQRVDAPDERRRERLKEHQQQVRPLNRTGRGVHRRALLPSCRHPAGSGSCDNSPRRSCLRLPRRQRAPRRPDPAAHGPFRRPQPPTFRAGVDIVHLDVSVLDANRRPVRGLTPADFTVFDNGVPQAISVFTAVDIPDADPPSAPWMRDVAPDVGTNDAIAERRLFLIIIDDAMIQEDLRAQQNVRTISSQVIDRLGPSDLAAVIFTRDNRHSQDFTADRGRLLAAAAKFTAGFREMGPGEIGGRRRPLLHVLLERAGKRDRDAEQLPDRRKSIVYIGQGSRWTWDSSRRRSPASQRGRHVALMTATMTSRVTSQMRRRSSGRPGRTSTSTPWTPAACARRRPRRGSAPGTRHAFRVSRSNTCRRLRRTPAPGPSSTPTTSNPGSPPSSRRTRPTTCLDSSRPAGAKPGSLSQTRGTRQSAERHRAHAQRIRDGETRGRQTCRRVAARRRARGRAPQSRPPAPDCPPCRSRFPTNANRRSRSSSAFGNRSARPVSAMSRRWIFR